jgi:predicted site-specific integrase-resolvase
MGITRKKLSTWAEEKGVHYRTALSWVRDGLMPLPVERTPGGHIRVIEGEKTTTRTVLYARVSSSDQKADLERQVDRLRIFAAAKGYEGVEVVSEIGSGLNGHRRRLLALLSDTAVGRIVVEHRDRLARFGVEYIEAALVAQGREVVVVESGEHKLDLVQDFVDVVTCLKYERMWAKRALAAAAEDEP